MLTAAGLRFAALAGVGRLGGGGAVEAAYQAVKHHANLNYLCGERVVLAS
ncbi:MAG: hypothetical protein ACSLFE_09055 [Gemmatimonadaceae bacterium]